MEKRDVTVKKQFVQPAITKAPLYQQQQSNHSSQNLLEFDEETKDSLVSNYEEVVHDMEA